MRLRLVLGIVVAGIAGFLLIQLIPYGRTHKNPPVSQEVQWPSSQVRDLAVRACYDCHSNQSVWPWYSNIAPVSWLLQHDVDEGRQNLNFSEWDRPQRNASKAAEQVQNGNMPKRIYLPLHPSANLTAEEKTALIEALKTIANQN